jgi:hypothetical protein
LGTASGDPIGKNLVFAGVWTKKFAPFVRDSADRFFEDKAFAWLTDVDSSAGLFTHQNPIIPGGIVPPEGELEASFAVQVSMARPGIAPDTGKDSHHLVRKTGRIGNHRATAGQIRQKAQGIHWELTSSRRVISILPDSKSVGNPETRLLSKGDC